MCLSALSEIFERADTSKTGVLSIPEYLELCKNYNIEVSQDDLTAIENIAENNGGGVSKSDFILFIRQSNMYAQFDTVDPESDQHWIDKTQQAWKMFDKVSLVLKVLISLLHSHWRNVQACLSLVERSKVLRQLSYAIQNQPKNTPICLLLAGS